MINFNRLDFYFKNKILDNQTLIDLLSKNIINKNINKNFILNDISSLDRVVNNSILFLNNHNFNKTILPEILIITSNKNIFIKNKDKNIILINDYHHVYNLIINQMYIHDDSINYHDDFDFNNGSYISKNSFIHSSSIVGKNCIIGRGVSIDKNCIIKNNVVIKNSIIKSNVIISDNSSIGTTGFGFDYNKRGTSYLTPHIGIVFLDENSHIGSSCCIDRGKIDATYIGKNSMIDNFVHVAHNVIINDNACIAAQTGISGSVKIGKNCTIGGQVGLAGHINIGDNVIVAAKSGVTKNIANNSVVAGFPAIDIKKWKELIINERRNRYKPYKKSSTS